MNALDYDSLRRKASLEADMEYYYGAAWRTAVTPSAATAKYVQRIHEVAATAPSLLIAHQYVPRARWVTLRASLGDARARWLT